MVGLIFGETGRGGGITGHNPESSPCGVLIRGSYTTDWTRLQARTMSGIIMISEKQAFIVTGSPIRSQNPGIHTNPSLYITPWGVEMSGNEETHNWLVHKYACWPTMDPMDWSADVRVFVESDERSFRRRDLIDF